MEAGINLEYIDTTRWNTQEEEEAVEATTEAVAVEHTTEEGIMIVLEALPLNRKRN